MTTLQQLKRRNYRHHPIFVIFAYGRLRITKGHISLKIAEGPLIFPLHAFNTPVRVHEWSSNGRSHICLVLLVRFSDRMARVWSWSCLVEKSGGGLVPISSAYSSVLVRITWNQGKKDLCTIRFKEGISPLQCRFNHAGYQSGIYLLTTRFLYRIFPIVEINYLHYG